MFREMRRKNKQISKEKAFNLLKKNEYGILSTVDKNNYPYGTPMNYIYLDEKIYLHCAMEGQKVDNIKYNDKVCFTVVGSYELVPESFTSNYQSIIVFGKAGFVDKKTKKKALREFIKKFSLEFKQSGFDYVDKAIEKTEIIEITIEDIKGKKND